MLSWGVLARGKFELKIDLKNRIVYENAVTKIQGSWRLQVMGSWLTLVWKIRTILQWKQVFIQESVCLTVCSSGTSGPPNMKNSMRMSSFERYRISIHFFLIEKLTTWVFKRKWENRLIRKCEGRETVPFPSRKKTYITIKYKGNLRLLVMGDITSERNRYHQSLRTLKKPLISKFRQCKHQLASISPN